MAYPGLPAALWNQDGADDRSALLDVGFGTGAAALLLRDDDLIIIADHPRAERLRFQCAFESVVDPDGAMVSAAATQVDVTNSVFAQEIVAHHRWAGGVN